MAASIPTSRPIDNRAQCFRSWWEGQGSCLLRPRSFRPKTRRGKAVTTENASTTIPANFDLESIAKLFGTDREELLAVLTANIIDPEVQGEP
jgi:hypothetical protein